MTTLRREASDTMTLRTAVRAVGRGTLRLLGQLLLPRRLVTFGALGFLGAFVLAAFRPQLLECCMDMDMDMCGQEPNHKLVRLRTQVFAVEGYARWSMNNPGKRCPTYLEELNAYVSLEELEDPWGTRFQMICGPGEYFAVVSAGPDGKFLTADDIHSRDPHGVERGARGI